MGGPVAGASCTLPAVATRHPRARARGARGGARLRSAASLPAGADAAMPTGGRLPSHFPYSLPSLRGTPCLLVWHRSIPPLARYYCTRCSMRCRVRDTYGLAECLDPPLLERTYSIRLFLATQLLQICACNCVPFTDNGCVNDFQGDVGRELYTTPSVRNFCFYICRFCYAHKFVDFVIHIHSSWIRFRFRKLF